MKLKNWKELDGKTLGDFSFEFNLDESGIDVYARNIFLDNFAFPAQIDYFNSTFPEIEIEKEENSGGLLEEILRKIIKPEYLVPEKKVRHLTDAEIDVKIKEIHAYFQKTIDDYLEQME